MDVKDLQDDLRRLSGDISLHIDDVEDDYEQQQLESVAEELHNLAYQLTLDYVDVKTVRLINLIREAHRTGDYSILPNCEADYQTYLDPTCRCP